MSLNVNRNVEDVFYRYKMPKLTAKVEGKGNGIKTVIVNMTEIAKALSRPPTYPTKYFGCELGAQTQIDSRNERYIVNGEHDANKLQDILDGFIQKYVLCKNCENPETNLSIKALSKKEHEIKQSCMACGFTSSLDQKHRLATYIIKNPPPEDEKTEKAMKAQAQKGKAAVEGAVEPEEMGMPEGNGKDHSSDEDANGTHEAAEGDNWVDGTDAVDGAGGEELTDAMKALIVDPDADLPIAERMDKFLNFITKKVAEKGVAGLEGRTIVIEAERLDLEREKAVLILARALFTAENVLGTIGPSRPTLLRFTHENKKAQRYLLGAMEQLVVQSKMKLLPKIPLIFQALYENDIVEEDTFIEWAKKGSKKFVSKEENKEVQSKAAPFIKWLQEAEEESDEEEEEDANIEFEEEKKVTVTNGARKAPTPPTDDDEDGIDIDDI